MTISANFAMTDVTTGVSSTTDGQPYDGPVAYLQTECIAITTHNLNITAQTPNCFIHTGSGDDAINCASGTWLGQSGSLGHGGTYVLDGGDGSNFLVGGNGRNTFFVDARNLILGQGASSVWSTVSNFHSGDNATMWGVSKDDFRINMIDNLGANGYKGLTIIADRGVFGTRASVTMTGYAQADIDSGKLTVSFGRTGDLPGLPGSNYMQIHANWN